MIYKVNVLLLLGFLVLFHTACERVEYFPDKPIDFAGTTFLAHHGAGQLDKPNTYKSALIGLNNLKGIECDIQMSSDGTLWLDHATKTPGCGLIKESIYPELSDKQIVQLDSCLGDAFDAYRLDSVFKYISEYGQEKLISLDVKSWSPASLGKSNLILQMNALAQSIIDLTNKYHLNGQVMVESETGDFLYYIKTKGKGIETYLSTNGDFELGISRALHANFTGISFHYMHDEIINAEAIDLIHRKGLKIQLWTLYTSSQIDDALLLNPDFIQTDDINYVKAL